ncbi:MAG TPA: hypothetical protein VEI97_05815, partial [bacterium]|nr:hypothetical protein [bacterium]
PPDGLPTGMLSFLPFAASANLAIWSDVLSSIGGWREDFVDGYEDVELSWRAQLAGHELAFAADAVMRYRLRGGLGQLAKQSYRYGRMAPKLYREYRSSGMPVSSRRVARTWLRLALGTVRLPVDRRYRGMWVRHTSYRAGRLAGSARHRVLYL